MLGDICLVSNNQSDKYVILYKGLYKISQICNKGKDSLRMGAVLHQLLIMKLSPYRTYHKWKFLGKYSFFGIYF